MDVSTAGAGRAIGAATLPVGVGVASEVGDGSARAAGLAVGVGRGVAVGTALALAVGAGVGLGVGLGVGFGVGFGVGLGVGLGVGGTVIVTDPPPRLALNRSRLIPSNVTVCVPAGSLPDQLKRTPAFQSAPLVPMPCVDPATRTRTQSAGDPSRLR